MLLKKLLILAIAGASFAVNAAEMDAAGYDRAIFAICKDNPDAKQCTKLVSNVMVLVRNNSEISSLCKQLDEKGGDSSTKPACLQAKGIDNYIDDKHKSSQ